MSYNQPRNIPSGTRVRLKVRAMSGWRGTATLLLGRTAIKDGGTDPHCDSIDACPHEWAVMRDQTPNPEHAPALKKLLAATIGDER